MSFFTKILILSFSILLGFTLSSKSQVRFVKTFPNPEIDSLKSVLLKVKKNKKTQTLIALSKAYLRVSPEKSLLYAKKARQNALKNNSSKLKGDAYNISGASYASLQDFPKAQEYYKKALDVFIKIKNFEGQANVYQNLGLSYHLSGEYDIALKYLFKAIELSNEHRSIDKKVFLNTLGNIYKAINDYDNALKYFNQALEKSIFDDDKLHIAYALNNLGTIYKIKGNYNKALEYYRQSLKIKLNLGDKKGVASTYGNIGNIHKRKRDYEKAYIYYEKAIDIFKDLDDFWGIANTYHNIAYAYLDQQLYKKALEQANLALDFINKMKDVQELRKDNYQLFYKIHLQKGNFKEALKYESLFNQVKDSLMNKERNEIIARIQARYEMNVKDKENELLKKQKEILRKDNQINTLKLNRSKSANYALALILILTFISLYVVYKSFQNRKKINHILEQKVQERTENLTKAKNKLLKTNKELDTFLYKASHDLKNPLSSLEGLCNIGLKDIQDSDARMYFRKQQKVIQNMYLLLFRVSEIGDIRNHKSKPSQLGLYKFTRRMVRSMSRVEGYSKVQINIDIDKNHQLYVDNEMLDIVIDNILKNAIQHAQNYNNEEKKPQVAIKSEEHTENINISISDNGRGIAENMREKIFDMFLRATDAIPGFGLGLYKARIAIEKINGEIKLAKTNEEGTIFTVNVPKKAETIEV